ncbi:MAG: hypothetical protein K0Q68_2957 [Moraxellaceae bacterium]|jgi:hypothetical protein|nr:hypothetical protein [Moraxellaceae bacterium]
MRAKTVARGLLVLAILALPVLAETRPVDGAGVFMKLYASLCVQAGGRPEIVAEAMAQSGIQALPAEEARFFLRDKPGTVWPVQDASGVYRVAQQADGTCAIFAQRTNAVALDKTFADFIRELPAKPPFRMVRTADERKTHDGVATHYQAFQFGIPGEAGSFLFALTTSPSVTSAVQALASFSRVSEGIPAPAGK